MVKVKLAMRIRMGHKGVRMYTPRQREHDHLHVLAILGTTFTTKG